MAKKFDTLRAQIYADPERRARVEVQKHAIATALALTDLREAREATQREVGGRMGVSQANVSRIEHEEDLYLSTLRSYVEALGGRLELRAVFPDEIVTIGSDTDEAALVETPVLRHQE